MLSVAFSPFSYLEMEKPKFFHTSGLLNHPQFTNIVTHLSHAICSICHFSSPSTSVLSGRVFLQLEKLLYFPGKTIVWNHHMSTTPLRSFCHRRTVKLTSILIGHYRQPCLSKIFIVTTNLKVWLHSLIHWTKLFLDTSRLSPQSEFSFSLG